MTLQNVLLLLDKDCKYVITPIGHDCASDICNIVHTNIDDSRLYHMPKEQFNETIWKWEVIKIDTVKYNYSYYSVPAINITIEPSKQFSRFWNIRNRYDTFADIQEGNHFALLHRPIRVFHNQILVFERKDDGTIDGDTMLQKYDECYYEEVNGDIYLIDMKEHVEQEVNKLLIMASQR